MKTIFSVLQSFFKKPFRYAICFAVILTGFSIYVILDTFIIEKVYAVLGESQYETTDVEEYTEAIAKIIEPVITDMSYLDENIALKIEKFDENGVVFYVADVKISDAKYLKTALPGGVFGKNVVARTSSMAKESNAIFAINGDYCTFKNTGVIMRNGEILRVRPRRQERCGLVIDENGDLMIFEENDLTTEKLEEIKAVQCFSFGPTLIVDGKININETEIAKDRNPRTAIGQVGPLHYIFIVVDGRTKLSKGMKFPDLAKELEKRGCFIAYNLDGGGSSTMWFNGKVVNSPNDGSFAGERKISDIIYIAGGV